MNELFNSPSPSKQLVPPRGDTKAAIAIVGSAPGGDDEKYMKAFAGMAGKLLLKDCCMKAGIPEYSLYLTMFIKERPKGDTITPFFSKGKLTPRGMTYLAPLKEELSQTTANVIVAVGDAACYALTGIPSVSKYRGSILESTLLPGRKVIPTFDPKTALAMFIRRYTIIHDLVKAKNQSSFPDIRLPMRNLIIDATLTDLQMWLLEFRNQVKAGKYPNRLGFDIEITGALELSCFALSYHPNEAICIPVSRYTLEDEMTVILMLADILEDPTMEIVGQNVNFDLFFMIRKYHIHPRCIIHDTMIGHNVLYPDFPKGLDYLCSIYTNEPFYKNEGKEWRVVKDWPMFWRYNAKDAACTLEIWNNAIEPQLHAQGYWDTYILDVEKHYPMFFPMLRGINADPPAIDKVKQDLEKTIWRLQEELDSAVESTITDKTLKQVDKDTGQMGLLNEASPKQVMGYFYIDLGIQPYLSKGRPTCDDKALQRLAKGTASRAPNRAAGIIQELRRHRKFRNTYLNMSFDADSRFRCTYNPRGTIFGRLSSSQTIFHTGMNQQNLPYEFKHFLLADPGYLYFELDGIQAEWVATAYIANEAKMMYIVESGQDPHAATAEMLTGLPMPLVKLEDKFFGSIGLGHTTDPEAIEISREKLCLDSPAYEEALKTVNFLPRTFSFRQTGKKSNHGFNYGMGPDTFAINNEVPNADARLFHKYYHYAYPGLNNWYSRIQGMLKKDRTLINPFGRKIRLAGRWGNDLFNQAYSFLPQSTIADQVRNCINRVYMADKSGDIIVRPSEFLTQTHDAVGYQYPISAGIEAMATFLVFVKDALEEPITYEGRSFTIRAECKGGYDLGTMRDIDITSVDSAMKGIQKLLDAHEDTKGKTL